MQSPGANDKGSSATDASSARRVAVVGAGPAGFYAAQALSRQSPPVNVDLYERLPVPYGLVRFGVAPDHAKLKNVTRVYDDIAAHGTVRFVGHVYVGKDIALATLHDHYDAVIVACGTANGKKQDIPGADLPGSVSAAEFVGWYNGDPTHQDHGFDLSAKHAVVIGNGNVALDVARLLTRPSDDLRTTDITSEALAALTASKITDVHILGRRGPVNASFGKKELREMGALNNVQPVVDPADLALNDELQALLDDSSEKRANYETLSEFANASSTTNTESDPSARRCHFHFYQSATALEGGDAVSRVVRKSNLPDRPDPDPIPCGLVVFCIGYAGDTIEGLPSDPNSGVVPNELGRVIGDDGNVMPGIYVAGWIKRGPTGLIGTNKADSVETVEALMQDLDNLPPPANREDLVAQLAANGHPVINYDDWERISEAEQQRGEPRGAPADKFTDVDAMLNAAGKKD